MIQKAPQTYQNCNTSRLFVPKIDITFSKIACPEGVWCRGSLTTPLSQTTPKIVTLKMSSRRLEDMS